jgi:hypothetical protein
MRLLPTLTWALLACVGLLASGLSAPSAAAASAVHCSEIDLPVSVPTPRETVHGQLCMPAGRRSGGKLATFVLPGARHSLHCIRTLASTGKRREPGCARSAEFSPGTLAVWRLTDRIHRVAVAVAVDQVANGTGRQRGLGQETDHWAGRDQVGVVLLGVG